MESLQLLIIDKLIASRRSTFYFQRLTVALDVLLMSVDILDSSQVLPSPALMGELQIRIVAVSGAVSVVSLCDYVYYK